MLAGRAGRAQLSTAGANLAELGRDPPTYGTVIEYMVHTFYDLKNGSSAVSTKLYLRSFQRRDRPERRAKAIGMPTAAP